MPRKTNPLRRVPQLLSLETGAATTEPLSPNDRSPLARPGARAPAGEATEAGSLHPAAGEQPSLSATGGKPCAAVKTPQGQK